MKAFPLLPVTMVMLTCEGRSSGRYFAAFVTVVEVYACREDGAGSDDVSNDHMMASVKELPSLVDW